MFVQVWGFFFSGKTPSYCWYMTTNMISCWCNNDWSQNHRWCYLNKHFIQTTYQCEYVKHNWRVVCKTQAAEWETSTVSGSTLTLISVPPTTFGQWIPDQITIVLCHDWLFTCPFGLRCGETITQVRPWGVKTGGIHVEMHTFINKYQA